MRKGRDPNGRGVGFEQSRRDSRGAGGMYRMTPAEHAGERRPALDKEKGKIRVWDNARGEYVWVTP